MLLTSIITGLILILAGIWCYYNPNMIKPYRNLPPSKKAVVDIKGLQWSLLWIMVAGGVAFLLMAVFHKQLTAHLDVYTWSIIGIAVAIVIASYVATIRHNGYGKGGDAQESRGERKTSAAIIASAVITVVVIAFVVVVLAKADKPSSIVVEEGTLHISGKYGGDFPMEQFVSMKVLNEMPVMRMRTNGSSFKNKSKGHFLTKDNESCLLFVTYNGGPYVELRTANNLIYLNCETREETEELINELKGAMK